MCGWESAGYVPVGSTGLQRDPGGEHASGGGARCAGCRKSRPAEPVEPAAAAAAGSGELVGAAAGRVRLQTGSWAPLGTGYDQPSDRTAAGRDGGGRETGQAVFAGVDMLFLPRLRARPPPLPIVRYVLARHARACLQHNVAVAVSQALSLARLRRILRSRFRLCSTPEPVPQSNRYHHSNHNRRQPEKVAPADQVEVVRTRHLL